MISAQLCREAYIQLFARDDAPSFSVTYSGKFKRFNSNISYTRQHMHVKLSSAWKDVDVDIQKGCVQSLLAKAFKYTIVDDSLIRMYTQFVHQLDRGDTGGFEDAELQVSYERVVDEYFEGFFDSCTVVWGKDSFRTLGHYNYLTNTITISTILSGTGDLLDFVMYHEMLHKKHKFTLGRKRSTYHSTAFRRDERQFAEFADVERRLNALARKHRFGAF